MADSAHTVRTTLDHVAGLSVPGTPFEDPQNEYWALACLWRGLDVLHDQVARSETEVHRRLGSAAQSHSGFGNLPFLAGIDKAYLTVAFHWYSVSAVSYVRMVRSIMRRADPAVQLGSDYEREVIPEVLLFRDKVGAHLVGSMVDRRDNDADKLSSLMPPLLWTNGAFHVGALAVTLYRKAGNVKAEDPKPWSIRDVHRRLRERYWPTTTEGA